MKTPCSGFEMTEKTNQNTTNNSQQMTNGQSNGTGNGCAQTGGFTPAASNQIMEKFRRMEEMESDDEAECPLCMEPLDIDDIDFFPCSCGYQVCRFCWHRLKDEENGLCPACRQSYPELPVHFSAISIERVEEIKKEKRKQKEKSKLKDNNKMANLATIRVVQKNLLFVIGFSARISQEDLRKEFLKYGKIIKMVINPSSAYVTYTRAEDAVMAIKSLNESNCINGKCNSGGGPKGTGQTIRASLGTTKYCSHWLRSQVCPKQPDCMYLHENADQDASFTKEQMQLGKHTEYEKRLIAHYTELLRKKEERAMSEKLSRTSSAVDVKDVNDKKKDSVVSATSNEKKSSSAIKINGSSDMNDDEDSDSSSSGNSSLSSSPAQNDVGSTFANYCPSSGVSSLNLCENTSDSLISSSSSGNSSKSSTPDNVQQQAKQQQQQQIQIAPSPLQNSSQTNVQNPMQINNHQQQNGHQELTQSMEECFDKKEDNKVVDNDDDDLDFDPIRFTLDDMLKSMSMESKIQNNGNNINTSPQSMRTMMNMNFNSMNGSNNNTSNVNNNNNSFMGFGSMNGSNSGSSNSFADSFTSYRMQNTTNSLFGNSNSQSPSLNRLFESATNRQQQQMRGDNMDNFMRQRAPDNSLFMSNNNNKNMLHERELNSFLFNQDSNSGDGFDNMQHHQRQRLFQQQNMHNSQSPNLQNMNMGQGMGMSMNNMMKSGNGMQGMQNSLRQLLPNVNINFRQGCDDSFGGFGPVGPQQQQHSHPSLSPTSLIAANSFFGPNSSSMRQNSFSSNNSMGSMNGFGGGMSNSNSNNSNSNNSGMGGAGGNNNSMLAHQQYQQQQQQQQQMMQRYQQHRNSSLMQQMIAMNGGNGSGNAGFNMGQQRQQAPPGF